MDNKNTMQFDKLYRAFHIKELNPTDRIILSTLSSLLDKRDKIIYSDTQLSALLFIHRTTISKSINKLIRLGYISTQGQTFNRRISPTSKLLKIISPDAKTDTNPPDRDWETCL